MFDIAAVSDGVMHHRHCSSEVERTFFGLVVVMGSDARWLYHLNNQSHKKDKGVAKPSGRRLESSLNSEEGRERGGRRR